MSEVDRDLYAKAMLVTMAFHHTIKAILQRENPNVDPYKALDELALVLTRVNRTFREESVKYGFRRD